MAIKDLIMSEFQIKRELQLDVSREKAFDLFVNQFSSWWPHEYTWSKKALKKIIIECKINGRCYEEGPNGFICQFGRVLDFKQHEKIKFTWQIGTKGQPQPDSHYASEITVNFIEKETKNTVLIFEHAYIEKHGEDSQKYFDELNDELNSEYGWDFLLNRFLEVLHKDK
jgi:uncharacterized protein YndB with AHSA1/START domain